MKILIDCRFWGITHTGLGRYTQNLVENLLAIDKNNQYFLVGSRIFLNNCLEKTKKNVTIVPTNIKPYSIKEQFLFPKLLRKIQPDLIHFPHFNCPLNCPYPFVVTVHDLIKHTSKGLLTTTRSPWAYYIKYLGYKTVFQHAVMHAQQIIVPSNFTKEELIKYYPKVKEKISVVYEGFDPNIRKNKGMKFNLFSSMPYLIYIGNAYPHKNLKRLMLALKMANARLGNKKINLIIITSRNIFLERLKKEIHDLNMGKEVILINQITDSQLAFYLQKALAFINPSLMEGFGLPGLEAMVNNCPVVCSNIGVFREIYDQAALFFNPLNVVDIKDKILTVLKIPQSQKEKLVSKARIQAGRFSWEKCSRQTLAIYNKVKR